MTVETASRQYLSFKIDSETYGIDVAHAREVLELGEYSKLPTSVDFLLGVINLRDRVVPVVDLRVRMGMSTTSDTDQRAIIVLEFQEDDSELLVGFLADSVDRVLELANDSIEPAPALGTTVDKKWLTGIGKIPSGFIMLLDPRALVPGGQGRAATLAAAGLEPGNSTTADVSPGVPQAHGQ